MVAKVEVLGEATGRRAVTDIVTEIAVSLWRRGFWNGGSGNFDQCATTMFNTIAELGSTAQQFSKWLERGAPDSEHLERKVANWVIAAVGTALNVVGSPEDLRAVIRYKLACDESLGALHQGGPLREGEPLLREEE